ncbi:MAG: hypothetical protein F6J98_40725 [Moorea sp. SIO4G2]|nr:hypothetical protein [Moorena sp. SIO4G2]
MILTRYSKFSSYPDSRLPIPDSRLPSPDSRVPIPDSVDYEILSVFTSFEM